MSKDLPHGQKSVQNGAETQIYILKYRTSEEKVKIFGNVC
jgi:hypothetical protein